MNKIKDFIYDKNDLLIALLIVAAAAFIITSRIDVIMAYPATLAAEAEIGGGTTIMVPDDPAENPSDNDPASGGEEEPAGSEEPPEEPPAGADNNPNTGEGTGGGGTTGTTGQPAAAEVSININPGSNGSDIAQLLINAGLIDKKETFYDAVTAAGAETRLQAGTFKIPSNATPAEIVKIITN